MNIDIISLLPEEISDEVACHIVNFFVELAVHIEDHYYAQIKRYVDENSPPNILSFYQDLDK